MNRVDLAWRAFFVRLRPMGRRRTEAELWRAFDEAAPGILGALLEVFMMALVNLPPVALPADGADFRMADFAIPAIAAKPTLGWPTGSAIGALRRNSRGAAAMMADLDPVAAAIRELVEGEGGSVGLVASPHGAEDETGDRPLLERARWLAHARFFVGLSSGLSWLAWSLGTPVVMISGFTHPLNDFATPYRVINYHACNGCWNDVRHRFDHKDFLWCPRHANTPRQFECTRLITAAQVLDAIRRVPGLRARRAPAAEPGPAAAPEPRPKIIR